MGKNIFFLIGFMGAGKTTLGKQIAQHLNFHFIDLDNFIELQENQTIENLFTSWGAETFRQKERTALENIITTAPRPLVLACGGGTPCYYDNLSLMQQNGYIIYLKAEPSTLKDRIIFQLEQRPLLKNIPSTHLLKYIEKLLHERNPYYWQADFVFNIERDNIDVILEFIEICSKA